MNLKPKKFLEKDEYKEIKSKGWVYESEHPDGILNKPCPICGYKYGSSWNYFQIPEEDEKIIMEILSD